MGAKVVNLCTPKNSLLVGDCRDYFDHWYCKFVQWWRIQNQRILSCQKKKCDFLFKYIGTPQVFFFVLDLWLRILHTGHNIWYKWSDRLRLLLIFSMNVFSDKIVPACTSARKVVWYYKKKKKLEFAFAFSL